MNTPVYIHFITDEERMLKLRSWVNFYEAKKYDTGLMVANTKDDHVWDRFAQLNGKKGCFVHSVNYVNEFFFTCNPCASHTRSGEKLSDCEGFP